MGLLKFEYRVYRSSVFIQYNISKQAAEISGEDYEASSAEARALQEDISKGFRLKYTLDNDSYLVFERMIDPCENIKEIERELEFIEYELFPMITKEIDE